MNDRPLRSAARPTSRAVAILVYMAAELVAPGRPPPGAEPSAAPNRPAPERAALTLGLVGEASWLDGQVGVQAGASLDYGPWRLRVGAAEIFPPSADASPRVGWALSGPPLAAGAAEPSGLAAFILRPHGLSYRLFPPSGRGRPVASAPPLGSGWIGAAVGAEGGLFALEPYGLKTPAFIGAWAAPSGTGLSALLAAADAPAEPGADSWYASPHPPSALRWLAGAAAFGAGPYRGAVALAVESRAPGGDAYALRHESRLKLAPFTLELVAALSGSPSPGAAASPWLGPRLTGAPPAFAQATLSYARRFGAASLRYTGELAPASAALRHAVDAGFGLGLPGVSLQAKAYYRAPGTGKAERIGLAARLGLGRSAAGAARAPLGLSAFGSWRAEGGRPLALELGAGLLCAFGAFGPMRPALRAEAAWRAAPEARRYRWRLEFELPLGSAARLSAFGRSAGWIAYELPGGLPAPAMAPVWEFGLSISTSLALY